MTFPPEVFAIDEIIVRSKPMAEGRRLVRLTDQSLTRAQRAEGRENRRAAGLGTQPGLHHVVPRELESANSLSNHSQSMTALYIHIYIYMFVCVQCSLERGRVQ